MQQQTAFVMSHESDPNRRQKSLSVQALTLTRSLGRHGVRVVRIHPNQMEAGLGSRYCSSVEICPDLYESEEKLMEFLEQLPERYPGRRVLLPATDDCALFVSRHWDRLEQNYAVPSPSGRVMERIIDKQKQYEAAEQLGIPIPETYFPSGPEEVRELASKLKNYPYAIKPTVAHSWRLASMQQVSAGRKAIRVENAEELLDACDKLGEQASSVMIQEVIGGRDERLYTFLTCLDRNSQPLGYCIRSKMRQWPVDFGYCTLTVSCDEPEVRDQSLRLLQGLDYYGIAGVEWKHDPRTGLYKLIEINARAVNTIGLAPACGVDIPYLAYMDAIQQPQPPVYSWKQGVKWIRFTQDFSAAKTLHRQGRLTLGEWRKSLKGLSVEAVFALDDPRPFFSDFNESIKRKIAQRRA